MLLISRRPEGSGRAARHSYLGRSSITPTIILLRKQKYRLIGICPFTYRAIAGVPGLAGANNIHQVIERRSWSRRRRGAKLDAEPPDRGSGFVV
jgi:hypothetical protein